MCAGNIIMINIRVLHGYVGLYILLLHERDVCVYRSRVPLIIINNNIIVVVGFNYNDSAGTDNKFTATTSRIRSVFKRSNNIV